MQELPVNGRNWQDLAVLSPGSRTNAVAESPTVIGSNFDTQVGSYQLNIDGQQVTNNVLQRQRQPALQPRRDRRVRAHHQPVRCHARALDRRAGERHHEVRHQHSAGTFSGYFRSDQLQCGGLRRAPRRFPIRTSRSARRSAVRFKRTGSIFSRNYEYEREPRTAVYNTPYRVQPGSQQHQAREQVSRAGGLPDAVSEPFDDPLYQVEQPVAS